MKGQNNSNLIEKVVITKLTREFAKTLMKDLVLASSGVLEQGIIHRILQSIQIIPNATKLVAYHTEKKRAIGFLCLEENIDWLYSIKYVFVDPRYRKKGVATRLFNYAVILAKEKEQEK